MHANMCALALTSLHACACVVVRLCMMPRLCSTQSLSASSAHALADVLSSSGSLTSLCLARNNLNDDGAHCYHIKRRPKDEKRAHCGRRPMGPWGCLIDLFVQLLKAS